MKVSIFWNYVLLLNLPHGRTFAISHILIKTYTSKLSQYFTIFLLLSTQGCLHVTRLNLPRVNLKNYKKKMLACVNEGAPYGGCSTQCEKPFNLHTNQNSPWFVVHRLRKEMVGTVYGFALEYYLVLLIEVPYRKFHNMKNGNWSFLKFRKKSTYETS